MGSKKLEGQDGEIAFYEYAARDLLYSPARRVQGLTRGAAFVASLTSAGAQYELPTWARTWSVAVTMKDRHLLNL